MCKTFILITQEAEKLETKHLPFFWDTLYHKNYYQGYQQVYFLIFQHTLNVGLSKDKAFTTRPPPPPSPPNMP